MGVERLEERKGSGGALSDDRRSLVGLQGRRQPALPIVTRQVTEAPHIAQRSNVQAQEELPREFEPYSEIGTQKKL